MVWPTGATRVAGVIGDPVRHSLSPVLHNAAFSALGLDWAYLAFPVRAGHAREALAGAAALGVEGLSVTMPHKTAVAEALDRCSPTAAAPRAVNTVVRDGDELIGESTDGLSPGSTRRAGGVWWSVPGERVEPWCWRCPGWAPGRWWW